MYDRVRPLLFASGDPPQVHGPDTMMKRPAGVVVAAVLLGVLALGLFSASLAMLLVSLYIHPHTLHGPMILLRIVGIGCLGFAVFASLVTVGLVQGRDSAQMHAMVIGVLLALLGLGAECMTGWVGVARFHSFRPLVLPFAIYGVIAASAIWMVVYLNTRNVRLFFSYDGRPPAAVEPEPTRPVPGESTSTPAARILVLIYAAHALLGALWKLGFGSMHHPAFFFIGALVHGESAFFGLLLFASLQIVAAVGLWRRLKPAYHLAMVLLVLDTCSSLTTLVPSVRARILTQLEHTSSGATAGMSAYLPKLYSAFAVYFSIWSLLLLAVFMWGLLRDLASLPPIDPVFPFSAEEAGEK